MQFIIVLVFHFDEVQRTVANSSCNIFCFHLKIYPVDLNEFCICFKRPCFSVLGHKKNREKTVRFFSGSYALFVFHRCRCKALFFSQSFVQNSR